MPPNNDDIKTMREQMHGLEQQQSNTARVLDVHLAECGEIRKRQSEEQARQGKKIESIDKKLDAHGIQLAEINTSLATIATREATKTESQKKNVAIWGLVVALAAAVIGFFGSVWSNW